MPVIYTINRKQKIIRQNPAQDILEQWRPQLREWLKDQPYYIRARHFIDAWLRFCPDFFPDFPRNVQTNMFGRLLALELEPYTRSHHGRVYMNTRGG
jgi:hypothetical protein